ncbi:MAG: cyclic nucleotide-binding domain-containing protein [Acidobacteriota bacterium]|nr:MAG: cyclic nucleotide-binding domain-containing protein [Acidobacteriota bacterium]
MESNESTIQALARLPHFRDLLARDREILAQYAEVRSFSRGEFVVREGEPGQAVFFLVEGSVEVIQASEKGKETALARLRDDVFGEMSFLSSAPRSAGIRALEDTKAVSFTKEAFHELCRAHPTLGLRVLESVSKASSVHLRDVDRQLLRALRAGRKHRIIAAASITALVAVFVWLHFYLKTLAIEETPRMTAFQASWQEEARYRSPLERLEATEVAAPMDGVVEAVHFADGDAVREGDALVKLEGGAFVRALRRAEAEFLKRRQNPENVPQDVLQLRLAEAELAVFAARAKLAQTVLRAPHAGTVHMHDSLRTIEKGDAIYLGDAVATVRRPKNYGFTLCVSEPDASRFPVGRTIRVRVPEISAELYGQVVFRAFEATPVEGALCRSVSVQIVEAPEELAARLPPHVEGLQVGMTCEVMGMEGS